MEMNRVQAFCLTPAQRILHASKSSAVPLPWRSPQEVQPGLPETLAGDR
ncbi:MAG: hypothetical protein ACLS8R_00610 [Anaeromassilibacillus sp.]